ncbi:MAG TPA: CU044_5270 family protein [Pseudonocardiaceae bacterium]|nr:CU044_5270 family protein [Pseudonocardiaceae bacterium]
MADLANVHPIWTEDELNAALADLHRAPTGEPSLAAARTALYTALDQPIPIAPEPRKARQHWRYWAAAAAVVTLLTAGTLLAQNPGTRGVTSNPSLGSGSITPKGPAASTLLRAATAVIGEQDPALRPGQYLYIKEDAWWSATINGGPRTTKTFEYLAENVIETWVPADQTQTWAQRRSLTGKRVWVIGTEQEAMADGIPFDGGWPTGVLTAPCGDFYPMGNASPSCAEAATRTGWQSPTPAWLASLPKDPQGMLNRLRTDAPNAKSGNGRGDAELVTYVADALRGGLVPANVRAVLYQALALLPDLTVTQRVATLNGRTGVAMGIDDKESPTRQEIIVDPVTGQFIGERTIALKAVPGFAAGAVTDSSSVTTSVVNSITSTH